MNKKSKTKPDLFSVSPTNRGRFSSVVVNIGNIPMGRDYPVRVQSMTNTDTLDTQKTVNQCIRIIKAGADYIRITASGIRQAHNLEKIKFLLKRTGYYVPLIADIHFNPEAAVIAARIVEKVRINPGNFTDKNKKRQLLFSEKEYREGTEQIGKQFGALLAICKKYHTALRIGVNHGSLSDRILSRWGDTPAGMVESAMEYLRVCKKTGFGQVVVSLKASNTRVMVLSSRLLEKKMKEESMNFPQHLGVTEAGEGEEAIIKSTVGIGTLLSEGIGETIRVSLTGEPETEIPVGKKIVGYFSRKKKHPFVELKNPPLNPYIFNKRMTHPVCNIGGNHPPVVLADLSHSKKIDKKILHSCGFCINEKAQNINILPDYIYTGQNIIQCVLPTGFSVIYDYSVWIKYRKHNSFPLFTLDEFIDTRRHSEQLNFVVTGYKLLKKKKMDKLFTKKNVVWISTSKSCQGSDEQRAFFYGLMNCGCLQPVVMKWSYSEKSRKDLQIKSSGDTGALLIDGLGDGLLLENTKDQTPSGMKYIVKTSFDILQASRARISKNEYISCPTCGRAQFDVATIIRQVKKQTSFLSGLKLAVMGCIVNGPGEMADADYGIVGCGKNKVNLYKGKEIIAKAVPTNNSVTELLKMIQKNDPLSFTQRELIT